MCTQVIDLVSRVIYSSSHFRASDGRIKWKAFQPKQDETALSVMDITGLTEDPIWALIDGTPRPDRNVKGRADLETRDVNNLGLRIIDAPPPPKHAHIIDWPEDEGDRILLCKELALSSTLHTHP